MITELMRQIAAVDPNADAFRYHTNTDCEKSASSISKIHLGDLRDIMTWASEWLGATSNWLGMEISHRNEMYSEYGP